jgi:hypothetical protein
LKRNNLEVQMDIYEAEIKALEKRIDRVDMLVKLIFLLIFILGIFYIKENLK